MNARRVILTLILIPFLGHTAYVIWEYGFVGFYMEATQNAATSLLLFDLFVSLAIILEWLRRDASANNRNPLAYILTTLTIGVAGPLLYLLRNDTNAHRSSD